MYRALEVFFAFIPSIMYVDIGTDTKPLGEFVAFFALVLSICCHVSLETKTWMVTDARV
jgi:hypothetical protein